MEQIIIEKLKQDFQNERREQLAKGKDIQKETMQRRRAMEMKAQLEAAKEEKRRQEALAERKAKHIEATMRFQKGLKHFKFNKERISLEQVLRDITPQRSRINSADDMTDRSASTYNNYIDPNYFAAKQFNKQSQQMNRLRKSSSFESLNSLLNANNNKRQFVNINKLNNHTNGIIVEPIKLNHNSNISQHLNAYNPETLTENTNFKINHQTKNIVYTDQLKDFQNLVANELNSKPPKQIKVNPNQSFYDTKNILTIEDYQNGLYNQNSQLDDDDSMETDSLLNLKIESPELNNRHHVGTSNKMDSDNDINDDLLFINNNIKKKESFNKNQLNSNYNSHVDASNLWFNNNKPNVKNQNIKTSQPIQQQQSTYNGNRNNSLGNIKENSAKEIKSILKRSSSLENNISVTNGVNFAVKPSSETSIKNTGVKDSIELTNSRKLKKEEQNENGSKKSVRFAHLNEFNDGTQQNEPANNNNQTEASAKLLVTTQTAEDQRISSTNSIRRPVIKPRNATINGYNRLQNKSDGDIVTTTTIVTSPKFLNNNNQQQTIKIDDLSEKPPAHPNTYLLNCGSSSSASGGSGSYSVIGQKRRELLQQRGKLNSGGSSSCSSSAGTASGSGSSALNDRLLNSPKSNSINIKIDVSPSLQQQQQQQLPLNRMPSFTSSSPLQSPNQFFPMPISNSSQSSSSFTNSNNSNNNNNFTNLKYVNEGNYRDYQLTKANNSNQTNSVPVTPTSNNIRLNNNTVIDMNLYKKLDISNYLDQQHQLNQMINKDYVTTNQLNNKQQEQTLTKIPLSPKSNLKPSSYYYSNNENIIQNKPTSIFTTTPEQIVLRRPASDNTPNFTSKPPTPPNLTPNATQLLSPVNQSNVPKTNIRFAYINSPLSSNNQPVYFNDNSQSNNKQQVVINNAAENVNNQKNQNQAIHLEIKYPLYSNHNQQSGSNTQYINITKPIAKQPSFESDPSSQRGIPLSISIEEQNVKNSIIRLNERLNMISNQRYNKTNGSDYLNRTNYDNFNKQKVTRPIATNSSKIRR